MSENKNIYINSLQASDIYEHQFGKPIKSNFVGMIPYSLNSIHLKKIGLKTYKDKRGKHRSNDIINLKFSQRVNHIDKILESISIEELEEKLRELTEKINNLKTNTERRKNAYAMSELLSLIEYIKYRKSNHENGLSIQNLREYLYKNGFNYNGEEYVVYKRTSAKSRTGQCQFIRKSLRDKSIRWARLGMNLDGLGLKDGVDFPSLLAYESLVDSSIIDTIEIPTKNIFIISDVVSKFTTKSSVIKNSEETNELISILEKNHEMESDIFDGESILDESYFSNGKGCMLLRNHMFKSCAFNGKVQQFLKDNTPVGIDFDEWELEDMFGNKIKARNIHLITTPNSLKALKFYKRKKTPKLMFEHWKKKVEDDGCNFGICKYEKESKRGFTEEGEVLNQLSYQIINSKPYSKDDIDNLSNFERDYVEKLKNDDQTYIDYLQEKANDMNANQMLVDIYNVNHKIVLTRLFKNKRKSDINAYSDRVRSGKIRVKGDYCVICQNPKEMLYHSIGKLPVDKNYFLIEEDWVRNQELKDNQAHTILHDFGREYPSFRNPHTAPSNVLILENKESEFISKYMNSTNNIIYTNAIGIEINRILSGQDVDSDSLLMLSNLDMLNVSKKCFRQYSVCDNLVSAEKIEYIVSKENMYKIDNSLSKSQRYIGEVVNLGQHCMSAYWEEEKENPNSDRSNELLELVDICTVLSEIAIDMAKKMYDVNFPKQIKSIKSKLDDETKPNFFKYVSKNKKVKLREYETAMDYLGDLIVNIERADVKDTIDIFKIIRKKDYKMMKKHKKQRERFHEIINEYINLRRFVFSDYKNHMDDDDMKSECYEKIDNLVFDCSRQMEKYKVTESTIYYTIEMMYREHIKTKEILTYLNVLYGINKESFLNVFM